MSLVTFNKLLCDMFGKILRENKYIYLIGDFNVNILHDVPGGLSTQEFKNIFSTNYCFPLINIPTRVTMNSASLIDIMYNNFPAQGNVCDSGVLKTSISDHYAIFCIANNAVVLMPVYALHNFDYTVFSHCHRICRDLNLRTISPNFIIQIFTFKY